MIHAGLPQLDCRCRACVAARGTIWRRLTRAQRRALHALDFAVPRHQTDLSKRDNVSWPTLWSLMHSHGDRPALVRQMDLATRIATSCSMPFFTLNQHGRELRAAAELQERKAA